MIFNSEIDADTQQVIEYSLYTRHDVRYDIQRDRMQLLLDGAMRSTHSIKDFRIAHHLPESFGVAYFEPKDVGLLGSVDEAGYALNQLREQVLAAVPSKIAITDIHAVYEQLVEHFRMALDAINPQVGLDENQFDFAVNGFADVCQRDGYALLRHHYVNSDAPSPDFMADYAQWIQESVAISATCYPYPYHDQVWQVQVISTIFGRIGMRIDIGDGAQIVYVLDKVHACPADGFMGHLLAGVTDAVRCAMR